MFEKQSPRIFKEELPDETPNSEDLNEDSDRRYPYLD